MLKGISFSFYEFLNFKKLNFFLKKTPATVVLQMEYAVFFKLQRLIKIGGTVFLPIREKTIYFLVLKTFPSFFCVLFKSAEGVTKAEFHFLLKIFEK